jgi:hypothetical protein
LRDCLSLSIFGKFKDSESVRNKKMSLFVAVDNIDKVFSLSGGGEYVALKGIDLQIKKGNLSR